MQIDSYVSERHKKRKKRRVYFYGAIALLVAYFAVAGIAWVIFRSPVFHVDNVAVKGNTEVASDAVISLMQSSALSDHSFLKSLFGFRNMFLWPSHLSNDALRLIPELKSVSIEKDYFSHTITATVVERQPFAIWCLMPRTEGGAVTGNEQCYWIDDTGTVFKRAFDTQGSLLFAVHDYAQSKLALSEKILPDRFFGNAISALAVLRSSGLKINEVALKDLSLEEIDATTYGGPAVYFSLRFPADNDLPVIQSLMAQKGFANLQYIDCRTENRVYYK